jgi:hypothetical protein
MLLRGAVLICLENAQHMHVLFTMISEDGVEISKGSNSLNKSMYCIGMLLMYENLCMIAKVPSSSGYRRFLIVSIYRTTSSLYKYL